MKKQAVDYCILKKNINPDRFHLTIQEIEKILQLKIVTTSFLRPPKFRNSHR